MTWILLIFWVTGGGSMATMQFKTEHKCLDAKATLQKIDKSISAICIESDK